MLDPKDYPGAVVRTATVRPESHDPKDYARALADVIATLSPGPGYFVRLVTQNTAVKEGRPKGRRYSLRIVFWPWPERES